MDKHGDYTKNHRVKMIAPIIITIVMIVYLIFYFAYLVTLVFNTALKILIGIIPIVMAVVMIGVCVQRIKEIKGGEEDDLSKY